jgi:hypothetical protein
LKPAVVAVKTGRESGSGVCSDPIVDDEQVAPFKPDFVGAFHEHSNESVKCLLGCDRFTVHGMGINAKHGGARITT